MSKYDSCIQHRKEWLRTKGSKRSRIDKAEFDNEKEVSKLSFTSFEVRK